MRPNASTGLKPHKGEVSLLTWRRSACCPVPAALRNRAGRRGCQKGAGRIARRCRGAGGLPGTTKKDQNGPPGADGELAGLQRIRKNYAKGGAMTQNGCENNMAAGRRACGTNMYMGEQENT